MRFRHFGFVFVAFSIAAAPTLAQQDATLVRGSNVTLEVEAYRRAALRGELIAVSKDSLWLLSDSGLVGLRLALVRSASLKRHSVDARVGLMWTLLGGAISGGLLTAACSTVEDGCGVVFAGTMLAWGIVGGISALTMEMSSRSTFHSPQIGEQLRGYARFPQGLPAQLDRQTFGERVEMRAKIRVPFW